MSIASQSYDSKPEPYEAKMAAPTPTPRPAGGRPHQ